ncbi:hypothetical protein D4S03_11505 [bacterium]|nr:MAG: hypothetical protein D4S03_11505 [bacterium]
MHRRTAEAPFWKMTGDLTVSDIRRGTKVPGSGLGSPLKRAKPSLRVAPPRGEPPSGGFQGLSRGIDPPVSAAWICLAQKCQMARKGQLFLIVLRKISAPAVSSPPEEREYSFVL